MKNIRIKDLGLQAFKELAPHFDIEIRLANGAKIPFRDRDGNSLIEDKDFKYLCELSNMAFEIKGVMSKDIYDGLFAAVYRNSPGSELQLHKLDFDSYLKDLKEGRKLNALKDLKEALNLGLKGSKDIQDEFFDEFVK